MEFRDIDDWIEYCRERQRGDEDPEGAMLRTGWAGSQITPPPSSGTPHARVPLERANSCLHRAVAAERPGERRRQLELARRWLDHPHPRASRELRRAMRRKGQRVAAALSDPDAPLESLLEGGPR